MCLFKLAVVFRGRGVNAWCKDYEAKSQGYLVSSILLRDFRASSRAFFAREVSEQEGRGSTLENWRRGILPRKSIFFAETSFREAGLSGAKLPAWRESTFLPAARLLSCLLLVLHLRGGYCARCEWFLRARFLLVSNA